MGIMHQTPLWLTLMSGASTTALSGAEALLAGETQGLALDFTDMSAYVLDTGTPANNFDGDPNSLLTYVAPSTKWVLGSNGLWQSGTTLRTDYDESGTAKGLNVEEQRTCLALHNRDGGNAVWSKTNCTAARTATGADGVSSSATTLTATSANATILQSITSASAARVTSVLIRRRTGSGTIELTQDGGSTWTDITSGVTTGAYTRKSLAAATLANPQVGIRLATSSDEVDIDFISHEVGEFVTSPIITYGAAATRAADNISIATSAFPWSATAGSYFVHALIGPKINDGALCSFSSGGGDYIETWDGTSNHLRIVTGGSTQDGVDAGAFTASTVHKVSCAFETNTSRAVIDGGTVANGDGTSTLPTVTSLIIGSRVGATTGKGHHIKTISYVPRRKSDAELQTETT